MHYDLYILRTVLFYSPTEGRTMAEGITDEYSSTTDSAINFVKVYVLGHFPYKKCPLTSFKITITYIFKIDARP